SGRRAWAGARHEGVVRAHCACAQPTVEACRIRIQRPLPRARAEDAARSAQRAELRAPQCGAAWVSIGWTGSVLVGRVVRRLAARSRAHACRAGSASAARTHACRVGLASATRTDACRADLAVAACTHACRAGFAIATR